MSIDGNPLAANVRFIGRTGQEYLDMFQLRLSELVGRRILDVAAGAASFRAEMSRHGIDVISVDPLYGKSPQSLERYGRITIETIAPEMKRKAASYDWRYYGGPARHRRLREQALEQFVTDYRQNPSGYIRATLPVLPFPDRHFDLVLCSHFLFLYDDQFEASFHEQALREMLRVCRGQVRVYPLSGLDGDESSHLSLVAKQLQDEARLDQRATSFRFMRKAESFLLLSHL